MNSSENVNIELKSGWVRESGMPDLELWSSFFDFERLLDEMGMKSPRRVLELGAGYGSFTFPLAMRCDELVAVEIEHSLGNDLVERAMKEGVENLSVASVDFRDKENLVRLGVFDDIVLFNILHMESPAEFLKLLQHVSHSKSYVHVLHWRTDIETPRGPSLSIRSTPEQCQGWFRTAGFEQISYFFPDAAPFHFAQQYRLNTSLASE